MCTLVGDPARPDIIQLLQKRLKKGVEVSAQHREKTAASSNDDFLWCLRKTRLVKSQSETLMSSVYISQRIFLKPSAAACLPGQ